MQKNRGSGLGKAEAPVLEDASFLTRKTGLPFYNALPAFSKSMLMFSIKHGRVFQNAFTCFFQRISSFFLQCRCMLNHVPLL